MNVTSNHRGRLSAEPRLDPPDPDEDERKQLRERLRLEHADDEEYYEA